MARYRTANWIVVDRERARLQRLVRDVPALAVRTTRRATAPSTTSIARLPYVRDMGFDVLYFPPIHPIGRTNRKGRNNTLDRRARTIPAAPTPSARAEGGHDADPPRARHARRFRPPGRGRRAATGSRSRSTSPSSARPTTLGQASTRSGSTGGPTARSSTPRTRRRSTRTSSTVHFYGDAMPVAVARAARRRPVLGRARREDLPRRQPAHQAVPVLGVADRRGPGAAPRRRSSSPRRSRGRR